MKNRNTQRRRSSTRNKLVSTINPLQLVKKARLQSKQEFVSTLTFADLSIHQNLVKNIAIKGYTTPTEIQQESIPLLASGKNLIGIAATGTGKTGAFLIPIIHQMIENKGISALVVVPTRELAQQVQEEFYSLTKGLGFQSACFIGGTALARDISAAKRNNQLIVGTPGRLNDLVNRRALNLNQTSILVLDEFDRMLDMGFINDVRKISQLMQRRSQTILFSATVDKSQQNLIKEFISNPVRINVASGHNSSDNVHQDIIRVAKTEDKFDVLLNLLNDKTFKKVILFAETKRTADNLSKKLIQSGLQSDVIHGNKSQNYRTKAVKLFKSGKTRVLVATDVAARGIDIDNVTHVVNYQIPQTMDGYIHRIGRTGRAGKIGNAFTFVN